MRNPIREGKEYVSNRRRWIILVVILLGFIYNLGKAHFDSSFSVSAESISNRKSDGLPMLTLEQGGFVPYNSSEHVGANTTCSDYEVGGKSIRTYQSWYDSNGEHHEGLGFCQDGKLFLKECAVQIAPYGQDDYCVNG